MTHVRTQVRQQVVAALQGITLDDGTPVPVYPTRVVPINADQFPCICAYMPRDLVSVALGRTPGDRLMRRDMTVRLPIWFGQPADVVNTLEDDADAILLQVENRMAAAFALQGRDGLRIALKATLQGVESAPVESGTVSLSALGPSYTIPVFHHELDASVALPQIQQRH